MIGELLACACLVAAGQDKPTKAAKDADKLVVFNEHNGPAANNGAKTVNVYLSNKGRPVWQRQGINVEWSNQGPDPKTEIEIPPKKFDKVRIEVVEWYVNGGGLSEVQVVRNGKNLAAGKRVFCPSPHRVGDSRTAQNLTDGILDSTVEGRGYWILPDGKPGWAEIDLNQSATNEPDKKRSSK